jgi:hypothetical protein
MTTTSSIKSGGRGGRKNGRAGLFNDKTGKELDAGRSEYFDLNAFASAANNGAAAPAAGLVGDDAKMKDEVL